MAQDEAYRRAERLIEKARRTKAEKLSFGIGRWSVKTPKLTELPEALGQLTHLSSLDLSNNQLAALPEWLGHLTQLRSLDLSGNQLSGLPESLGHLTQLQSLNLSDNGLRMLPPYLGQFDQLKSLELRNNELITLPETLGQLTQLQSLNVSDNKLKSIPEWISQLAQLQSLDVAGNQLTVVPECLSQLKQLQALDLSRNGLIVVPECLGELTQLQDLGLSSNELAALPESLSHLLKLNILSLSYLRLSEIPDWVWKLTELSDLSLQGNRLTSLSKDIGLLVNLKTLRLFKNRLSNLPDEIGKLSKLERLYLDGNELTQLPDSIGELTCLNHLELGSEDEGGNKLTDLPATLLKLEELENLWLVKNPLNPELAAAHKEGLNAVRRYLSAKAQSQVFLNEAKLILVGEGEVGKSCLLCALRDDPWEEDRPTTHGIEIKPVMVINPATGIQITLNGWDFGGQRVYRPTHQLFFSAPAVYLVAWKPREGSSQGFVRDWIKLVKHREPDAKILVVATHGGPKKRQPDINRQELWDIFGKDTIVNFFHVDSKSGDGISDLKKAIASVATSLPEVGRPYPKHWQEVREKLRSSDDAYLALEKVFAICKEHKIEEEDARLLLRICHRVGDLIYYEHDPLLKDIVVLKPDWLATAISLVLDDKHTREEGHGLVKFERLGMLWHDPDRSEENRYPASLHPVFLRLMERFDLSYRIAEWGRTEADSTSLIAQLVPDMRPENDLAEVWPESLTSGDEQQVQICRIVDTSNNQSATAEGLFYQLIVRLHKYSLGRVNFRDSVHWQRGLVLQDDTGGRAFLEHIGTDVKISVRSPYPPSFLGALTYETKWLVEDFWKGMRCEITVPCLAPKTKGEPCMGLFEVGKLLENKKRGRPEVPCPICNEWQSVEQLLGNAPAARPNPLDELVANLATILQTLGSIRMQLSAQQVRVLGRFDHLDAANKELIGKVEAAYSGLMQTLLDEAKEGPRLFSLQPVDAGFLDRPNWLAQKFQLTLWCEHSRQPLPFLNAATKGDTTLGVYEFEIPRDWFVKAAPVLKTIATVTSLVLPVASAQLKLGMDETAYKAMENQLDFGQKCVESVLEGGEKTLEDADGLEDPGLPAVKGMTARGAVLRQLHTMLKEKDPSYAKLGLVRVQNKRQEFLWVHPQFEKEY
ncbi:MAG TPA: COR domain-containing protein [Verrucomicrobiae bacterium]